ncbi:MAG: hypothetical protein WCG90_08160 [Chitinophagia bacterium]
MEFRVYADFDTQQVYVATDPHIDPPLPTVNETILGFTEDQVIVQRCVGTTLYPVQAKFVRPYAYFASPVLNSPFCSYTPPTCDVRYNLAITNAVNGSNNGKIKVDMITTGNYTFSLDGAIWQTDNEFTSLFPGSYVVYVREDTGVPNGSGSNYLCNSNRSTRVDNDIVPVTAFTPIPYQDANELCYYFKIEIDGTETEIAEPIGWGEVNMKGERDSEYHGYQFQYTDGQTKLKFDCAAGKDLIQAVYDSKGGDGTILFKFGYTYRGTDYLLFPGKLMLHTWVVYPAFGECVIESDTFDAAFQSRLETKVSMARNTTYDGTSIVAPLPYNLELHAKETLSQFQANTTLKTYQDNSRPQSNLFSVLPAVNEPQINDLADSNTFTLLSSLGIPPSDSLWIHKFTGAGKITLDFNWNLYTHLSIQNKNLFSGGNYDAYIVFLYRKFNPADNSFTETREVISSVESGSFFPISTVDRFVNVTGTKTLTNFQVYQNDEIYFYMQLDLSRSVYVAFPEVEQRSLTYSCKLLQNDGSSNANVWFLDDAIRHTIRVISDNAYVFRSDLFERANPSVLVDGQASKRVLTNGFQIRRFNTSERPLQIDLKTILASLNAQNCIGVNYTKDQNGSAVVRIERRDYFYQENEILAFDEVEADSYSESVATDLIYNELEFGYSTFQTDGFNSLDEFNTKNTALTPIKKNLKKLSQISNIITSGYSLEVSRRSQFKSSATDSVTNDDNPFMVAVKRTTGNDWGTEKNESFSTVTGIVSPETAYNLRLSPKRMLVNWFIWLKGIFAYKLTTEAIKNTSTVQNGGLITQFAEGAVDVIGDINKGLYEEKGDVLISDLTSTRDIYTPEFVNFTTRCTPDKVQILNAALTGTYNSTKNYGYIMVKKPSGEWQAGWVSTLTYNFWTQKLTIKMLKKFSSPEAPNTGECCEWLVDENGCFILANGLKLIA